MPLERLTIRNFAIIDGLDIELSGGLTIITGETGAGKSIVFNALSLLLGARADAGVIRHEKDECEITAEFSLAADEAATAWLDQHELGDDDACIVRRIIRREKSGKCYINDRPVTLKTLRSLGQLLVDIHGQHEHQALLRPHVQREIVDHFAENAEMLEKLSGHYRGRANLERRLEDLEQNQKERSDRIDLLRFQLGELEEVAPEPGEFAALDSEHRRLANAQELIDGLQATAQALYEADEDSVSSLLETCRERIAALSVFDDKLRDGADLLASALAQTDEAADLVRSRLDAAEHDPGRLEWVEQRMATLVSLARKHRCEEDELPERLEALREDLAGIEDQALEPDAIRTELAEVTAAYTELAIKVRASRQKSAEGLSKSITDQMQDLGMQGGSFLISVNPMPEGELSEHGMDEIAFEVSTNPGVPLKPLGRTASGGELSRISLAIEVVNSQASHVPTLMFDEVDVGVGGKVAEIVGQRLRALGAHAQVISVTHLPQVAAQGDSHFLVAKTSDATREETYSSIIPLGETERVQELARMLGGMEITERTLAHAHEMLKQAS